MVETTGKTSGDKEMVTGTASWPEGRREEQWWREEGQGRCKEGQEQRWEMGGKELQ